MGPYAKQIVFGVRQRNGPVAAFPVLAVNQKTLFPFILRHVARGSTIYTDENPVYIGLRKWYSHLSVVHSKRQWVAREGGRDVSTASIESFWNVVKRKYRDHTWWSKKHSPHYIDEAAFRLNHARPETDTFTVLDRIVRGAIGKRLKYRELTGG